MVFARTRPIEAGLILLCLTATVATAARAERVDSSCTFEWWQMEWNVQVYSPIGQAFVATADRADFVELMLREGESNSEGAELAVVLHVGGPDGSPLATSRPLALADGESGIRRFLFDPPVALEPGVTYTVVVGNHGTTGYAMVRGAFEDPCPQGQAWIAGQPSPQADLWLAVGRSDEVAVSHRGWAILKSTFNRTAR